MIDSDSARRDESNDMCFEAGRRLVPEIASAHAHCDEIRLDELNKNPSTAHRLVEMCSRYLSFSSAHAQLPNSSPIFSELADSGAERRDMLRSRFTSAHARQLRIAQPAHAQTKTPISLELAQRRDTCRSIRLDELHLNPRPPKRSDSNCATAHAQKQNDDIS